mmetsp:Transcript_12139/g.29644  ORF Transcript_12139/g.29644 Transcript_12139/m.29644 type:complete len:273 (+) Transcript_12139:511-1329(+)
MPRLFSHSKREERHFPSLGDFLNTFSALWTLDSKSLATSRSADPPDFIKAKWAWHAFNNWEVSISSPRRTDANVWQASSSFLHDFRLFRLGRIFGMLTTNRRADVVSLPHSRPMFFPICTVSCRILPPSLPMPCFTLLTTIPMGFTPPLRGRRCCCIFIVRAAAVDPPRRNGTGMRGAESATHLGPPWRNGSGVPGAPSVMHLPIKRREIKKRISRMMRFSWYVNSYGRRLRTFFVQLTIDRPQSKSLCLEVLMTMTKNSHHSKHNQDNFTS